jgi:MAF protein
MLILASNSPRRQELLRAAGWSFTALPADIDEQPGPDESAADYVLRLAEEKAKNIQRNMPADIAPQAVIVAADTTVVLDEQILGKPVDAAGAKRMLRRQRGRTHQVYTGLAILRAADRRMETDLTCTDVTMRNYSDAEMIAYIDTGDALDKAGAYAIQHNNFHPVENLQGCYANVVGLPVCKLSRILNDMGQIPTDPPRFICTGDSPVACEVAEYFKAND